MGQIGPVALMKQRGQRMEIETRELEPAMWPALEQLFGANGACGGCWCMSWRRVPGDDWEKNKGEINKARFKELVTRGKAHGALAFSEGKPVGWCSFDRRVEYAKLDRAPSLKCEDAAQVWSVPCFFVHQDFRGQGVGEALLAHAVKAMKKRGVKIVEGYPVKPEKSGKKTPAAFAWTGTRSLFAKQGFVVVGNPDGGKQRVRKEL
jgi:GNAT superfamily N-acetyltransferase